MKFKIYINENLITFEDINEILYITINEIYSKSIITVFRYCIETKKSYEKNYFNYRLNDYGTSLLMDSAINSINDPTQNYIKFENITDMYSNLWKCELKFQGESKTIEPKSESNMLKFIEMSNYDIKMEYNTLHNVTIM